MRKRLTGWLGIVLALAASADARAATTTAIGSAVAGSGDSNFERVLCPDGAIALGGGIDPANVLTMRITSSAPAFGPENTDRLMNTPNGTQPAPAGWQASARNDETFAQSFKVAAICSPGTTASTEVASAFVDAGMSTTLRVLCPGDGVAISGGVDPGNILYVTVNAQGPVFGAAPGNTLADRLVGTGPAPRGWEATVRNDGGTNQAFKVAAICSSEGTAVTQIAAIALPASTFQGTRVQCPAGLIATGGGVLPSDPSTARDTSDGPAFGTAPFDGLFNQSVGTIGAPVAWEGYLLNESAVVRSARIGAVCVPEPGATSSACAAFAALATTATRRTRNAASRNSLRSRSQEEDR